MQQEMALKVLKSGRNVFLTGAAGSGKTYVLNQYIDWLRRHRIGVGVTASTGIAATHLGGQTIHAFSGIGVRDYLDDWTLDALTQKQYLAKRFERTEVLIVDEVSMLGAHTLEMVDQVCRALKRSPDPFGGMQVVLSGDFFQLPPVGRGAEVQFAYVSPAWQEGDIRTCYLSEQHRHDDITLTGILNELRSGQVSSGSRTALEERIGAQLESDIEPTRLYSHNADVDSRNNEELAKLSGRQHSFTMTTRGRKAVVESLKKSVLTPEQLELKEGAQVMFVKNDRDGRFVNGTLGTVVDFQWEHPVVETLAGERIEVEPMEWTVEEDGRVLGGVTQVPLRLAWAITIHKSQGMSMDAAEIDLTKTFTPGQGYVALSRVRTLSGLLLRGINDTALSVDPRVADSDTYFREDSEKWQQVVGRFSDEKIQTLHEEFIQAAGGVLEEQEPEKPQPKKSTYEQTRELLADGKTLDEIASARSLTKGTVIGHLIKLSETNPELDLSAYKPKAADLKKIRAAFKKVDSDKLTPVHRALGGKYSFDELRLARLFL